MKTTIVALVAAAAATNAADCTTAQFLDFVATANDPNGAMAKCAKEMGVDPAAMTANPAWIPENVGQVDAFGGSANCRKYYSDLGSYMFKIKPACVLQQKSGPISTDLACFMPFESAVTKWRKHYATPNDCTAAHFQDFASTANDPNGAMAKCAKDMGVEVKAMTANPAWIPENLDQISAFAGSANCRKYYRDLGSYMFKIKPACTLQQKCGAISTDLACFMPFESTVTKWRSFYAHTTKTPAPTTMAPTTPKPVPTTTIPAC